MRSGPRREGRERGAAATEFALVVVPFLLLVFGSIEFGWAINKDVLVNNAAREGAREGSLNPTAADVESVVRSSLSGTAPGDISVSVTCRRPGGAACSSMSDAESGGAVVVTVDVRHDWVTPFGAVFSSSGITLSKTTEMRIE
ncbi:TadE/TadG family type IV pilus assembly protein [Nocardioides sp. GCM10027113]|uniref:TadE/TadG family type IV pilus assembly protein n=1 Tax=unclassified Nocardioides TaxID=2615069 RepID=UPI00362051FC